MDEIVGHEDAHSFFDRALSASSLHHAYLVLGPEHVGKTTFVEAVASRILSTTPPRLDAHPDFVRVRKSVDEKTGKERTEISVEQIRALRETLSTHPVSARYRLAFIE